MSVLEIVLLVVGIVLMIASFFITEKLSNKELDKIAELSTEEMQKILEHNLNDAQVKVNSMVDQVVDHSIEKSMEIVERALDKETNEKMRVLTEYSDTVLESINKTHNEVMFLYSMLNDKHSELTKYAGNLAQLAIQSCSKIFRKRWTSQMKFFIRFRSLKIQSQIRQKLLPKRPLHRKMNHLRKSKMNLSIIIR